jgi:hypothetical protein
LIDSRALVRALERRDVAEWCVVARDQELGVLDGATAAARTERRARRQLVVAVDVPAGRGVARLAIDALDGTGDDVIDQAIALARAAIGPTWPAIPPAAPAKVELLDPRIAAAPPLDLAAAIVRDHARPGATIAASVLREHVVAQTKQGLHVEWDASIARAELVAASGDRSLAIARAARRIADLDLPGALDDAARDLALHARAGAPIAGRCTLVLEADALLHGGLGAWQPIADQANALVARQGLARYRIGEPIVEGADQVGEPLSVASDGALAFGLDSAPIGDDGDAVRRFAIVDRGVAVGLGMSPREAALRNREPNGGVRNLVVDAGSGATARGRAVRVRRLRDLAIDRYTTEASLELALALDDDGRPFSGGTVRLDLVAALARARRAVERIARGAYVGPRAIAIDDVELVA